MIDWQLMRYVSPVMDLFYFLYITVDKSLRDSEYDNLLLFYYEQLSSSMLRLGADPEVLYSFENFLQGFKLCGNFAFMVLPPCLIFKIAPGAERDGVVKRAGAAPLEEMEALSEETERTYEKQLIDSVGDLYHFGYFTELPVTIGQPKQKNCCKTSEK